MVNESLVKFNLFKKFAALGVVISALVGCGVKLPPKPIYNDQNNPFAPPPPKKG